MNAEAFLRRLGFDTAGADQRFAWRIVVAVLLLYSASFFVFYPDVVTNDDEATYLGQSRVLLRGAAAVTKLDSLTGGQTLYTPGTYPIGTALVGAPFVWAAGWRAAYLAPLLSLVIAGLIIARWLQEEGYSPVFALFAIGFPATLVMGRVFMSDVPSLAVVSLGLWLFWRGLDRGWPSWLGSGFVGGASTIFRETNAVLFVPLYAGALLRREKKCWALIVGGLAGIGVKLLSNALVFGDPFFLRQRYNLALDTIDERLLIYSVALLVVVPGGLILGAASRGRRWQELAVTLAVFSIFYLLPRNYTPSTALANQLILDWRYMIPLLPLLAFGMAESVPRLWQRLLARRSPLGRTRLRTAAATVLLVWLAGVASASVAVHWAFDRWSAMHVEIYESIHQHTGDDSAVVINRQATRKYLRQLERKYVYVDREHTTPSDLANLIRLHGEFFIVFVDRSDDVLWQRDVQANAAFIESLKPSPQLVLDRLVTPTYHLRIWRVTELRSNS